jgi:hypothetical protein
MKRWVQLKSFNGTVTTSEGCKSDENQWLLIGQFGTVVGPTSKRGRVVAPKNLTVHHCMSDQHLNSYSGARGLRAKRQQVMTYEP